MSFSPQEPNQNQNLPSTPPHPPPSSSVPGLFLVPEDKAPHATPEIVDGFSSVTLVDGQVDPEALQEATTSKRAGDRQVVPDWVRSFEGVKETFVDWVVGKFRFVAFHVLRTHVYVSRLVKLSPLGAWLLLSMWGRWVRDAEYKDDRKLLKSNSGDIRKLKKDHHSLVSNRILKSVAVFLAAVVVLLVVASLVHTFYVAVAVLAALCGLGAYGAPQAKQPILERASYKEHQAPKFTESLMIEALRQCGAEPKNARKNQVIQPPVKIKSGWEAIVSVGVEATSVIEKRSRFATVLDRPENCVWLSADNEEAAGWLRIVVTRKSLRRTNVPAWPFLESGSFNWFSDEVPLGIDETGQPVGAKKAYRSTVGAGMMGSGKTVSMLTSVVGQAVDPRVELHIIDLKGGTDWEPLEPIAHTYVSGSEPKHHKAVLKILTDINNRMDARFNLLKTLPEDLKSPKTNDRLASMKHLDLHPIVIQIDETQELFEFAEDAKKFEALVSRIVKKGRAVGITVEAATQEVNKKTLPIAGMCHWRLCHSVQGHGAVDLVLGTGAYKAGFNADALSTEDVGIGYFGSGKDITVFKSYYIDPDNGDLDRVVARLRTERQQLGLLTGQAAGEEPQDEIQESTLDLVAKSWPAGVDKLQWVQLVDILHKSTPADYPKVTDLPKDVPVDVAKAVDSLSSQLLRDGVKGKNVRSRFIPKKGETSSVRRGVHLADIATALDNRGRMDNIIKLDTEPEAELDTGLDTGLDIEDDDEPLMSNVLELDTGDDGDEFDTDLDMDDIADLDEGA